jgi:hypothetical protein
MSLASDLGKLTAIRSKQAFNQNFYNNQNPFAASTPYHQAMPAHVQAAQTPQFDYSALPGSPAQGMAQEAPQSKVPDKNDLGGIGGAINTAFALNPATAATTMGINAAMDGWGYLTGKNKTLDEVNQTFDPLHKDENWSYLDYLRRPYQAIQRAVSEPISMGRHMASQFAQHNPERYGILDERQWQHAAGIAGRGLNSMVGGNNRIYDTTLSPAKNFEQMKTHAGGYLWDQLANTPTNKAFNQTLPQYAKSQQAPAPAAAPAAPATNAGPQLPKPAAIPAAPKPTPNAVPTATV